MSDPIILNGQTAFIPDYLEYHQRRISWTLNKLKEIGAKRIVEIGGHPWAMTASLADDSQFEICATVSAEEITRWPDDIGVNKTDQEIVTAQGKTASFVNYSVNIERTLFDIDETPDTVLACEIVEHLIRSPHVMFLNINRWLSLGGKLLVTTPNGAQFSNPFRRKSVTPAYRCNVYERHSYLYTLEDLIELVTLCGFKVSDAGYWDGYNRNGLSKIYGVLSRVPLKYFKDKFKKMIYLVGEKEREVKKLSRSPRVYDPRGNWEFIA